MLELLLAQPLLAALAALVVSLLVGSFLNVVILRLPVMMQREWEQAVRDQPPAGVTDRAEPFNLMVPRSRCGQCGHPIRWYENIPLLSWLLLRGRCSQCGGAISVRYPLVELLSGVAGGWLIWQFGPTPAGVALVVLSWALIVLTGIDLDHQLLPDSITLPLLWLGLLLNTQGVFTSVQSAIYGAAAGYLLLWALYWLFKLATGKEGMGYGDFKLLAAIGAWGGVERLPLVILLSSVVAVVVAFGLIALRRHQAQHPLPFGPFLALAGWIALVWGDQIITAYLRSF